MHQRLFLKLRDYRGDNNLDSAGIPKRSIFAIDWKAFFSRVTLLARKIFDERNERPWTFVHMAHSKENNLKEFWSFWIWREKLIFRTLSRHRKIFRDQRSMVKVREKRFELILIKPHLTSIIPDDRTWIKINHSFKNREGQNVSNLLNKTRNTKGTAKNYFDDPLFKV